MISFKEAHALVLANTIDLDVESVTLDDSLGRITAEPVYADRDFPPFDRVTKDGIAIQFETLKNGLKKFKIQETAAAGQVQKVLKEATSCIEVMTGAMLPKNTDTVIMYEHIEIKQGHAVISKEAKKGQNIHYKGSDEPKGSLVISEHSLISPAEIGVLASVGKSTIKVKRLPKVAVIATGDELVDVNEKPKPHQIRKSNSYTLKATLAQSGIEAKVFHFKDSKSELTTNLKTVLNDFDVLLLSGGVSKGKFDYLPEVLYDLGVEKIFHCIKQRPGKPFWFGINENSNSTIFAFPGNPASTFANYHIYFIPWLTKSLGMPIPKYSVILAEPFSNTLDLTRFLRASVKLDNGVLSAKLVLGNGSGDLTSLCQSNGFVLLEPLRSYKEGEMVAFYPTKRIV